MGLRILHSADWHLDTSFAGFPEDVRLRLRQAQRELPDRVAEVCLGEKCDLVLLAGDIFDGKPGRESIDGLKRALKRCGVPVLISPGNHDCYGPESPWHLEQWPENVHIFRGGLESVCLPELDCRVYGAAYESMDCPPLLEGFHAQGTERYCVCVLHGDPLSVSSPYCPVTMAQVRESGLDYLALGHIHRSGSFRGGESLCGWPGCPMGRNWSEAGARCVYLVELEETARITPIELEGPQFRELRVEENENWEAALERVLPPGPSPDFFRVTMTGRAEPDVALLRRRFSHLALLELRDETFRSPDTWDYAGEDSFRGTYFRLLQDQLSGASPERAELIRLTAEISRKLLEGREVLP